MPRLPAAAPRAAFGTSSRTNTPRTPPPMLRPIRHCALPAAEPIRRAAAAPDKSRLNAGPDLSTPQRHKAEESRDYLGLRCGSSGHFAGRAPPPLAPGSSASRSSLPAPPPLAPGFLPARRAENFRSERKKEETDVFGNSQRYALYFLLKEK
jgi:hypothetical protein